MHYNMLTISIIPIIISNYLHYKKEDFLWNKFIYGTFFFTDLVTKSCATK